MRVESDGYRTPDEMVTALTSLHQEYPEITRLVNIGESLRDRPIVALEISATDTPYSHWRLLGGHHGDELSSSAVTYRLASEILARADDIPELMALLELDAVWIVPHVNPDGLQTTSRYNANGVDLNRNYGFQWSSEAWASGSAPFSEPESRAIRTLSDWSSVGAGLSLHSGATNIGWVWNYTTDAAPDTELIEAMGASYADTCGTPGFWTTNGASWYLTQGDTNDWSYGRHGTLDFTLEVSLEKAPPSDSIPEIILQHLDAGIEFLLQPQVLRGRVTSALSGLGLPSTIRIGPEAPALTTSPGGRFGRPVNPGTYEITIESPGYETLITTISTNDSPEVFELTPTTTSSIEPPSSILSRGGTGILPISTGHTMVSLTRPGHPSLEAVLTEEGWFVSLDELAPGPWTLVLDDNACPRCIFVGEYDTDIQVIGTTLGQSTLSVSGTGFRSGSAAWLYSTPERIPTRLPLVSETESSLEFDLGGFDAEGRVDLLVLSGGYQIAVLEVTGDEIVDTGDWDNPDTGGTRFDTGSQDTDMRARPDHERPADGTPACGCLTSRHFPRGLPLVSLLLLLSRRRRS